MADKLKELQALPLERKIGLTQARVSEWYNHWDGKVYVSFSGGKDSTVLLDIVRKMYPEVPAVFCDTGLEYPEIRNFVKTKKNVIWLKPEKIFKRVIEEYGYPVISKEVSCYIKYARKGSPFAAFYFNGQNRDGSPSNFKQRYCKYKYLIEAPFKISDECCNELKKKPFKKYAKETGRKPITGQLAEESALRKRRWEQNGCNAFRSKSPISNPLSIWTEQDILQYLKIFKIEISTIYGEIIESNGKLKTSGVSRTGCMFCMFGAQSEKEPNRFQRMAESHPEQWNYCINKLKLGKVLDFVRVPYDPAVTIEKFINRKNQ